MGVREVTYMRMLFTQRQQLHCQIARYYEELRRIGQRTDDRTNLLLAHHWRGALMNNPEASPEDMVRAASYMISAATLCLSEDNREEGEKYLNDCENIAMSLPMNFEDDQELIIKSLQDKREAFVSRPSPEKE